MILYVVRHGETDYNMQGRYSGSTDVALNSKGFEQAKQIADKLKGIHFDVIVSSSLLRARQTAEIINEAYNLPIVFSDDFQERNVGVYEGLTRKEAEEKYPDSWKRNCTRELDDAPTNGETIRQFDDRIKSALTKLEEAYHDKCVLLVTHGFASRIINRIYKGLSYDEMHGFSLGNCDITEYII